MATICIHLFSSVLLYKVITTNIQQQDNNPAASSGAASVLPGNTTDTDTSGDGNKTNCSPATAATENGDVSTVQSEEMEHWNKLEQVTGIK